ncbi:hypothetical protein GCM10019017_34800 [Streptomyces showdoensis]
MDHGVVVRRHELFEADREFVRPLVPESSRGRKRPDGLRPASGPRQARGRSASGPRPVRSRPGRQGLRPEGDPRPAPPAEHRPHDSGADPQSWEAAVARASILMRAWHATTEPVDLRTSNAIER